MYSQCLLLSVTCQFNEISAQWMYWEGEQQVFYLSGQTVVSRPVLCWVLWVWGNSFRVCCLMGQRVNGYHMMIDLSSRPVFMWDFSLVCSSPWLITYMGNYLLSLSGMEELTTIIMVFPFWVW